MRPKIDKPGDRAKIVSKKYPYTRDDSFRLGVSHQPTPELRAKVKMFAAMGARHIDIAQVLKISDPTLRKYYGEELATAKTEANAQVAGKLFQNAMNGNVIAQIFWLKAQANWVDRREVNHNHNVGPMLSQEDRLKLLAAGPDADPAEVLDGESEEVDPDRVGGGPTDE